MCAAKGQRGGTLSVHELWQRMLMSLGRNGRPWTERDREKERKKEREGESQRELERDRPLIHSFIHHFIGAFRLCNGTGEVAQTEEIILHNTHTHTHTHTNSLSHTHNLTLPEESPSAVNPNKNPYVCGF